MPDEQADAPDELDVRPLSKPDKHPTIFAAYSALPPGGSFVLINDHDPRHLRAEFEIEHPRSHGWAYLRQQPRDFRIRITKLSRTPLPRVLVDTSEFLAPTPTEPAKPDATGAVWKLQVRERDLDSNVVTLPPGTTIDPHNGPDVDVLVHVLGGTGQLVTETDSLELAPGALLWLPRRSRRSFAAGPDGLRYLTVHRRRQALELAPTPPTT